MNIKKFFLKIKKYEKFATKNMNANLPEKHSNVA